MFHFAMGWNCAAHFISQWAGIDPPMFHFAMDHHAFMDSLFIAASDFIAASRASPKCNSLLITLNQVGMLCFNEPIALNLPPFFPSHPLSWAVFYRPPKQPTPPPPPPPPLHGPPRWQQRLPLRRRATTTGPESLPLLAQESSRSVGGRPLPPCRRASTGPAARPTGPIRSCGPAAAGPLPSRRRGRRAWIRSLLESHI